MTSLFVKKAGAICSGRGILPRFGTSSTRTTARSTTGAWRPDGRGSRRGTWSYRSARSATHVHVRRHERTASLRGVRVIEGQQGQESADCRASRTGRRSEHHDARERAAVGGRGRLHHGRPDGLQLGWLVWSAGTIRNRRAAAARMVRRGAAERLRQERPRQSRTSQDPAGTGARGRGAGTDRWRNSADGSGQATRSQRKGRDERPGHDPQGIQCR